jgi:hypothetical protein
MLLQNAWLPRSNLAHACHLHYIAQNQKPHRKNGRPGNISTLFQPCHENCSVNGSGYFVAPLAFTVYSSESFVFDQMDSQHGKISFLVSQVQHWLHPAKPVHKLPTLRIQAIW